MLNNEQIQELRSLGDTRDRIEWRIGEIAKEAWDQNITTGGKYYKFQIFTAVAREARCSKGRVEKLYNMVSFYPPEIRQKYPNYKLGHFETAMNFGPDEAPEVLEYAEIYAEDKGVLPKVSDLDFLYRREIKGQDTEQEVRRGSGQQVYNPDVLQEKIIDLMKSIRGLLLNRPLSDNQRDKISKGIELIESALIDEGEVITYN